jgi:DNA-binding CsgD family transcriptional regulator
VLAAVTEPPDDWSLDWLARNAQALARRAPGAAASLLERALADLDVHDSRHTVLREQLAMAYFTLTRYERAEVTAAILAQRESDAGDPGKSVWLRTHALMRLNRYQEAIKALESAARIAQPLWRARFIALRALCLYDSWQYAAAGESVAEAVALNRDRSDPIATSHVLYVRSALSMHNHDMGAALRDIDKGLTIGDGTAPVEDVHVLMLANRAYLQFETGRIDESATTARHAIAMAENTGSPRLNQLRVAAAAQAYERGDWDEAATELELAEGPDTSQTPGWHGLMALIEGRRGKARQMSVHLRALAELDNETVIPHASMLLPWNASRLAAAALESERAGRPGRAAGILGRCLGPDILLRRRYRARYKVLPELIRLALAHGDEATALAAARACAQDAADGADDSSPIYWTDRWCAGVIGREPARVLAAADYFRAAGLRPSLAGALQDAAVLLSSQPDPGPARAALAEALRTYDELGASWDARQATERLRAHGIRVDARRRRRPAHGWQSLSAAELPVARLAAEGLSNPGIAARLHISRRTVESHVSRILSKLEISSRVQIGDMAEP